MIDDLIAILIWAIPVYPLYKLTMFIIKERWPHLVRDNYTKYKTEDGVGVFCLMWPIVPILAVSLLITLILLFILFIFEYFEDKVRYLWFVKIKNTYIS